MVSKADKEREYLDDLRHSCSHLLAAAVLELWPDTKRAIGPPIENGFYYDFEFKTQITEQDFPKIEKKMRELLKRWKKFEKKEIGTDEARDLFRGNRYKLELISEFAKEGKKITIYKSGNYVDLCRGGHVQNPSKEIGAFKLLNLAGAYWRGNEKNKMLTRIYATCFLSESELKSYLKMLEEAKKRDHKIIGPQLGLFMFHETAPGMPYWLPNGLILYNELIKFWRDEHSKLGYKEIASPLINKKELYVMSGHWEHYKENMFIADIGLNEVYCVKPMNCPNAMIVFQSEQRSYRDFPLRFSDTDRLHRYEKSGTLNGLLRVRGFQQDDSHNFIPENMIGREYEHLFFLCKKFYGIFGFEYSFRLGTKPEKFLGDVKVWDRAERALKEILKKSRVLFSILEGDGAFYGPKVDIIMKDALGREWQMGTFQLDFQLPLRFNLKYTDKDGKEKTPVVVHRVIYGSLERFIGILTEHFAGAFPLWISPIQTAIIPLSEKHERYMQNVVGEMQKKIPELRLKVFSNAETLQKRIRNAQIEKIPHIIVVGEREEKNNTINVRLRSGEVLGEMTLEKFAERVKEKIKNKALDL